MSLLQEGRGKGARNPCVRETWQSRERGRGEGIGRTPGELALPVPGRRPGNEALWGEPTFLRSGALVKIGSLIICRLVLRNKARSSRRPATRRRTGRKILIWNRCNPLKSPDSDE